MASPNVAGEAASATLAGLLDSPEIGRLIEELQATRWTGRPGYPIRTMVGLALAKSLYALPTWTKTVALVREHWALQRALGCEGNPPSVYAAYRFAEKFRDNGEMAGLRSGSTCGISAGFRARAECALVSESPASPAAASPVQALAAPPARESSSASARQEA